MSERGDYDDGAKRRLPSLVDLIGIIVAVIVLLAVVGGAVLAVIFVANIPPQN